MHWLIAAGPAVAATFGSPTPIDVDNASDLEVVDFDGDGDLDIVLADYRGGVGDVRWHSNQGVGSFSAARGLAWVNNGGMVISGDLDGDGDLDLVVGALDDQLYSFEHLPGDTVGLESAIVLPRSTDVALPLLADLDNDGADLVHGGATGAWGYLGIPGSIDFRPGLYYAGATGGTDIAMPLDLDADGDTDLLLGPKTSVDLTGELYIVTNGGGTVGPTIELGFGPAALSAATADLDGDGLLDVVACRGSSLAWYRNNGVDFDSEVTLDNGFLYYERPEAVDLDDGDFDLVGSNDGGVWAHENLGGTSFSGPLEIYAGDPVDAVMADSMAMACPTWSWRRRRSPG